MIEITERMSQRLSSIYPKDITDGDEENEENRGIGDLGPFLR